MVLSKDDSTFPILKSFKTGKWWIRRSLSVLFKVTMRPLKVKASCIVLETTKQSKSWPPIHDFFLKSKISQQRTIHMSRQTALVGQFRSQLDWQWRDIFFYPASQLNMKIRLAISSTIQSIPSTNPSPVTALHEIMLQCRSWLSFPSSNSWQISFPDNAPVTSCLFAKINSDAPASRSCWSNVSNSLRHKSKRNLSDESTTQMSPSVDSK